MKTTEEQKAAVQKFRHAFRHAPKLTPIHKLQEHAARPRPFKGPIWASNVTIPALDSDEDTRLRARLWDLLRSRGGQSQKLDYPARSVPLHGEWIGYKRSGTSPIRDAENLSDEQSFEEIQKDCHNDLTVFYLSGNGWMRSGPPGSRPLTQQLSQYSGSRIFTMSTRLAPQHTLPTIMLDALIGYLYFIAPPPGTLHRPVDPSNLILAGESGGATLHLAVLQFIQYFSSLPSTQPLTPPTLQIRGVHVALKMPRGCAFHSPPCDLLSALPAAQTNESIDWMPERGPWFNDDFPADHVWPSSPPRAEIYVDTTAMTHPLVQPSCWTHWKGMPPVWISCGQERYADGIKYLVRSLWCDGVKVRFLEYDGMVHSFAVGMPWMPQSKHCVKLWEEACREIGEVGERYEARANGVAMGELDFRELKFEELLKVEHGEVIRKINERVEKLKERIWTGPKDQKAKI